MTRHRQPVGVTISPLAARDVEDHYVYIGMSGQPAAARRFLEAFAHTAETLRESPAFGRPLRLRGPDIRGMRRCPVIRFHAFQIIYRLHAERVEVVRVLHGSRDIRDALDNS